MSCATSSGVCLLCQRQPGTPDEAEVLAVYSIEDCIELYQVVLKILGGLYLVLLSSVVCLHCPTHPPK